MPACRCSMATMRPVCGWPGGARNASTPSASASPTDKPSAKCCADNDVPVQFLDDGHDGCRVFFQGHDGVFRLPADHPASGCLRALLDEAIRRKARVWFVADTPDLTLLDILPAGWTMAWRDGGGSGDKESAALAPKKGVGSS